MNFNAQYSAKRFLIRFALLQCVEIAQKMEIPLSIGVGNSHDLVRMYDEGRINVKRIIPHPELDKLTLNNDVALLELEEPLEFSSTVLPGCLDMQRDRKNYGDVVATGFGLTSKLVIDPETDRAVKIPSASRFLKQLDNVDLSEISERCQKYKSNICVYSKPLGTSESVCLFDNGKFSPSLTLELSNKIRISLNRCC